MDLFVNYKINLNVEIKYKSPDEIIMKEHNIQFADNYSIVLATTSTIQKMQQKL